MQMQERFTVSKDRQRKAPPASDFLGFLLDRPIPDRCGLGPEPVRSPPAGRPPRRPGPPPQRKLLPSQIYITPPLPPVARASSSPKIPIQLLSIKKIPIQLHCTAPAHTGGPPPKPNSGEGERPMAGSGEHERALAGSSKGGRALLRSLDYPCTARLRLRRILAHHRRFREQ
jgi:hypothetical protein